MTRESTPISIPLIEAQQITLMLDQNPILRDVSLRLQAGERIGLVGANGAGKTSLLRVLGGLLRPSVGRIMLMGQPLESHTTREIARMIARVPQNAGADFSFTIEEVVLMGRSPHLGRFQPERQHDRDIAVRAMTLMGVADLSGRLINTLSGGEQQRVFIARALAQEPRLLLLDEPTANLDVRHQIELLELATRLAQEEHLGIIIAIHDIDMAARYCDRLLLFHEGHIIAEGSPEAVLTPENITTAFQVQARLYRDPFNQALRLSLAQNPHRQ